MGHWPTGAGCGSIRFPSRAYATRAESLTPTARHLEDGSFP
jgi:hypothetical protein